MKRRTVLRGAAGLVGSAVAPSLTRGETVADPVPDLRIDIYVAEAASGHAEAVNYLAARMQRLFEDACPDLSVQVGPVGLVDVPDHTQQSPKAAWRWWREHAPETAADSALLLVSYDWWDEPGGYAGIGESARYAVSCGVDYVRGAMMGNLAIHEVGHTLGLRHHHADPGTLMNHTVPSGRDVTFSETSIRALRANT